MRNVAQAWNEADETRLRELSTLHSNAEIAQIMGRSVQSVKSRVSRMRLRQRNVWALNHDALIKANYRDRGATWCAEQLRRTKLAVYHRASKLGLMEPKQFASDEQLLGVISELHPLGCTDSEVVAEASSKYKCAVNRHRIGILRRKLGLKENKLSNRARARTREKTVEQLRAAGLSSLAELRIEKWNQWKRDLGWPENLTVRAVQALELFWRHGQLTRVQLCELMGVSARKRTAPTSNAPGGTVLGELAQAGFICRLPKAIEVPGDMQLHQQPCKNSANRKRQNRVKHIDLYFLNPGVKPNEQTRKHIAAG